MMNPAPLLPPLPTLKDVESYMLASIQLQHPEWLDEPDGSSPIRGYERKLHELMAAFESPNPIHPNVPTHLRAHRQAA